MSEATQDLIGKILKDTAQRDAIHIAVAPVVAARTLQPGSRVGLAEDGRADNLSEKDIGVVDPFLKAPVKPGERFFLFLFPNTIRSLRHEWTHPAFAADPRKAESEEWLRQLADRMERTYEDIVAMGVEAATTGQSWAGDTSAQDIIDGCKNEFFDHLEIVTGARFNSEARENAYFSCAC